MVFQEMLDMERREGRAEGQALVLLSLVQKKYTNGKPLNVIAEEIGEPEEALAGYYQVVSEAPDKNPEELLELLQEEEN